MSRKARKFKGFFRPKLGDLKKKKKKKRSSPKFRVIFWPKSEIQSFFRPKSGDLQKKKNEVFTKIEAATSSNFANSDVSGGLFSNGGAIFLFSEKIGLKSTKSIRFCILHKPMGGARAPPWLRYWVSKKDQIRIAANF